MDPILIVGAGMAGYTLAREFRRLDKSAPLAIVTADDGGFYSKPMLSNAFAQKKEAAQLVTQSAAQMAAQLDARIFANTRVQHIDTGTKTVHTDAGPLRYASLVLAVGAQPIRLPIPGDAAGEILSVNHIDDYALFRTRLRIEEKPSEEKPSARVAILGAGLIGCEFADDLAAHGHAVTLVDPNPLPLAALAAPALSQALQAALIARGIGLRLGTTAQRVDHAGSALHVTLADGGTLEVDAVLSAVGLRPDTRLAQTAGIAVRRGIVVDAFGRTGEPDVYALGDCAEYTIAGETETRPLPYIAPIMTAARAIARTLAGQPTPIDLKPAAVIVKTPCFPLALVPPPSHAIASGRWETERDGERTVCRFVDDRGRLLGFGVGPQDAGIRARLLAALATVLPDAGE